MWMCSLRCASICVWFPKGSVGVLTATYTGSNQAAFVIMNHGNSACSSAFVVAFHVLWFKMNRRSDQALRQECNSNVFFLFRSTRQDKRRFANEDPHLFFFSLHQSFPWGQTPSCDKQLHCLHPLNLCCCLLCGSESNATGETECIALWACPSSPWTEAFNPRLGFIVVFQWHA